MSSPADLTYRSGNWRDIAALGHRLTPDRWRQVVYQCARSAVFTVLDDGKPVAVAGLCHDRDGIEIFLFIEQGLRGSPRAAGMVRRLIRLFRREAPPAVYGVGVADGHEPGRRLAEMAGFTFWRHLPTGEDSYWLRLGPSDES
ncbi:MAG: hypothetical protein H6Q99_312 [Proteobacteria bacterium]|nr:hypothetical protein [Pseudomonadota bacterium]